MNNRQTNENIQILHERILKIEYHVLWENI